MTSCRHDYELLRHYRDVDLGHSMKLRTMTSWGGFWGQREYGIGNRKKVINTSDDLMTCVELGFLLSRDIYSLL